MRKTPKAKLPSANEIIMAAIRTTNGKNDTRLQSVCQQLSLSLAEVIIRDISSPIS